VNASALQSERRGAGTEILQAMKPTAKRVYRTVAVSASRGSFLVTLDGRPVKTPAQATLAVPTLALAEALAEEWDAQDTEIRPAEMPLTRLCATTIDRVVPQRPAVVDNLVAYGAMDLVCYRAEQPADLRARQQERWQPLLDWLEDRFGARLAVTDGVVPIDQDGRALDTVRRAVDARADFSLAALASAVEALGSLVIGLALVSGRVGPEEAFAASQVDEDYQIERWGEDAEAAERRRRLLEDVRQAARLDHLTRDCDGTP